MRLSCLTTARALRAAAIASALSLTVANAADATMTFRPQIARSVVTTSTLKGGMIGGRSTRSADPNAVIPFTYTTLDDAVDPTFNQVLGINNAKILTGYYGSGAAGHPNQGYTVVPPYAQANYVNENFPGAVQTQVIAINNKRDTAGFWVDAKGVNFGFVEWNGVFKSYKNPFTGKGTVNQLLGINDAGIAAGFFTDIKGLNHAYLVNQATSAYTVIKPPGLASAQATAINDFGDVAGFGIAANGATVGWLLKAGKFAEFDFPGSTNTQAFGLNKNDVIVGAYLDGAGATHGFRLSSPLVKATWQTLDDPNGVGNTFANGINDNDYIVGFYIDAAGNTNGFLATP